MPYRYRATAPPRHRATAQFWKNFHGLPPTQKDTARDKFRIFREDPFDPRLRSHKIQSLSSLFKRTVHAVVIEGDLWVVTFNIGTHDFHKI